MKNHQAKLEDLSYRLCPTNPRAIIRVNLPLLDPETGNTRCDYAVIICDPVRWHRNLGLPSAEERRRMMQEQTLEVLETQRDPTPSGAGPMLEKMMRENSRLRRDLLGYGDKEDVYERNETLGRRKILDACWGHYRKPVADMRMTDLNRRISQLFKVASFRNADVRRVILDGLDFEDALEMQQLWQADAPVFALKTRPVWGKSSDETLAKQCLDTCSSRDFQVEMGTISEAVWQENILSVLSAESTLPIKMPSYPRGVKYVLWGCREPKSPIGYRCS